MKIIKLLFYKILHFNSTYNKDLFFSVCNNYTNKEILKECLIKLLINYKSFSNKTKTLRYIRDLETNSYNLNEILYYLTNGVYCCILKYVNFKKKVKISIHDIDIDFKDNTKNNYSYSNIFYDPDNIFVNELIFKSYKYEILEKELITSEYLIYRDNYLSMTVYNRIIS